MEQIKGFVYWTQYICPHTASVFEELGKKYPVVIVCSSLEYGTFGGMNLPHVTIKLIQSSNDVDEIIHNTEDYIHINSAVKTGNYWALYNYSLRQLVALKCSVYALYMEQFQWWSKKGLLRRLQWWWLLTKGIGRHLKAIGCTGQTGVTAFQKSFIPSKRLFDFIYSVPPPGSEMLSTNNSRNPVSIEIDQENVIRFLYVGQIISRKFILNTVEAFNSVEENYRFDILGGGPQEKELEELIKNNSRIHFHGKVPLLQAREWMKKADVLILPSVSEGWGCTTNEGLMYGCRILVSDAVGSRALIQNKSDFGKLFKSQDIQDLKRQIKFFIEEGKTSATLRKKIADWAVSTYPDVAAAYLEQVVAYYENISIIKPTAPWC